jgi:hypothetical protein
MIVVGSITEGLSVYCSHGHTDGLVQTFAVVIGDGQEWAWSYLQVSFI